MAGKLTRWRWVSFGFACLVGLASVLLPAPASANGMSGLAVNAVAAAPANLRRPEIVMVDPGAEALRPMFEQIVNEEFDAATREFDWWPDYPTTVYVATEEEAAVALFRDQFPKFSFSAERGEQVARGGRGFAGTQYAEARRPTYAAMLFALQRPARRSPAFVRPTVAHEFSHFAQIALATGGIPQWFMEGQAKVRGNQRHDPAEYLVHKASRDLLNGKVVRVGQAETYDDWASLEGDVSADSAYARAEAMVTMLVEQHGGRRRSG